MRSALILALGSTLGEFKGYMFLVGGVHAANLFVVVAQAATFMHQDLPCLCFAAMIGCSQVQHVALHGEEEVKCWPEIQPGRARYSEGPHIRDKFGHLVEQASHWRTWKLSLSRLRDQLPPVSLDRQTGVTPWRWLEVDGFFTLSSPPCFYTEFRGLMLRLTLA